MSSVLDGETPALGTYLYCLAGPDCLAVVQELADEGAFGVDERYPVVALTDAGLVAVTGDVVVAEFSEKNLQILSWVGCRASRHEAIVQRIMDASSVLPVKFGTIFRSRSSLMQFLEQHRDDIISALDNLRDKTEWSVKGYIWEQDARAIIAAEDATIQSLRTMLSSSPGVRYLQQKQLDGKIDVALEAGLAQATHDLVAALTPHTIGSTALRRHASAISGRGERMVFNGSFLLSSEMLPGFLSALSVQQDACKAIGMAIEVKGPWPPYNFCPDLSVVPG